MTKGNFSPVAVEEDGDKPKKGVDVRRILMIVAVVVVVVVVIALIVGVVVYFMSDDSSTDTGMTYEPNTNGELFFEQGQSGNYDHYTKQLREFVRGYENEMQVQENSLDCEDGSMPPELGRYCRFLLERLGNECVWQQDFGYDEGQPCIFLSLDRREGWMPQISTNSTMPAEVRARYQPGYFPVSCEGVNEADKQNLGSVQYWPSAGFPSHYFPYMEQEGYVSPAVAVQFEKPEPSVAIEVQCQVWVDNLDASIEFTLLVD